VRGSPEQVISECVGEVLAREQARLARVQETSELTVWRDSLIDEVTNPRSSYMVAMEASIELRERVRFLERWAEYLAGMVGRLNRDADATGMASLILAAVHGGAILSRLTSNRQALEASLDFALAPLIDRGASVAWDRDDDRAAASGQAPDRAGREDAREDRRGGHGPDAQAGGGCYHSR
jgi:hypothetical protein